MPANVEIKARARDVAALRNRLEQLGGGPAKLLQQVDTFFVTNRGRLKLRESDSGPGQLIYYERPDQDGPKRSDYSIFEARDPGSLKAVLTLALGIRGTVEKVRSLYMIGQTRVHLDEVKGLGSFVELEVVLRTGQSDHEGRLIAEGLIWQLGVARDDLLESAYMDMLEQAG